MAIEFSWHIPNQVILARISGITDGDDLRKGQDTVEPWMNASSAKLVHVIFDCTQMKRIAFSVSQELSTLKYLRHEKMGGFVVVGLPSTQRAIANLMGGMINRMTRAKFSSVRDMETAMLTIRKLDPSVPNIIPTQAKPATEPRKP